MVNACADKFLLKNKIFAKFPTFKITLDVFLLIFFIKLLDTSDKGLYYLTCRLEQFAEVVQW